MNLRHANDIKPHDLVEIHIDYRMMGVAGDDSWGIMKKCSCPRCN